MKILLFIIAILVSVNVLAQNAIFRIYQFECSELFDIDLRKPDRFKVIEGLTPFKVNEKDQTGMWYRMVLESKDKDCLFLLPVFLPHLNNSETLKSMFYGELKAALNLDSTIKRIELDSARYITILPENSMENCINADTVFIWKAPLLNWYSTKLPKCYNETFNECIGINILKQGHQSAMMKILLTTEGKKKEKEYIRAIFNSIHYGDNAPEYNQKRIDATRKKMKLRFMFHGKKKRFYTK